MAIGLAAPIVAPLAATYVTAGAIGLGIGVGAGTTTAITGGLTIAGYGVAATAGAFGLNRAGEAATGKNVIADTVFQGNYDAYNTVEEYTNLTGAMMVAGAASTQKGSLKENKGNEKTGNKTINTNNGKGTEGVAKAETTTVGRWMSQAEYETMVKTGKVPESFTGTTHVANPATSEAFGKQAKSGTIYVEFDVTTSSLKPTNEGWSKIVGPNSLEGRLAVKKGNPLPEMPSVTNIKVKGRK